MSRCFPFPPPGYERKHKPEDLDLLKEAKCKEKRHKKEKKDKVRKKDKEKDKDQCDEKHREKKDRKEKHKDKKDKHKDKKKDKEDRGKEKEKSSISEELTVAEKVEEQSGGKVHPKRHSRDSNTALFQTLNGGKPSQSSSPSQGIEDSKLVQELDQRIRDEKKGRGSQLPEKVALVDAKDQEMGTKAPFRNSSVVQTNQKDDYKNKRIDRKMDPQFLRGEYSGDASVPNVTLISQSKVERISREVDEQNGRRMPDKEKYKETCDLNQGHKQKDKESHRKVKDKEKEKRKQDVAKLKSENKKGEQGKLNDLRNNIEGVNSNPGQGPVLLKDSNNNAVNEANLRKRKDMDTNGFLHEVEIRPNKMQKQAPHQLIENGRKPEGLQTLNKPPHDKHAAHNSIRVDKSNQLANGIVEALRPSPLKPISSTTTPVSGQMAEASKLPLHDSKFLNKAMKVPEVEDQIAEASRRPPHPDSKYLGEVLTIPKMADWSEIDDQDWLFSKKGPLNKPKAEPASIRKDPCVWSETVNIEAVDICALPYVIPY